ncbi:MAG: tRNA (adenosine(37)-N6)-threonylcarbamoyltransferase complex ATPase subunit type 1 TsaE [Bacteroidota bacterium]
MMQLSYNGPNELNLAVQKIIDYAGPQRIWALDGEMAAGKTTLIRSLCALLGCTENVTSPTYQLVNVYHDAKGNPVYHFDFYRIRKVDEAYNIGIQEYLDSGNLCLIEWPGKVVDILPQDTFCVIMEIGVNEQRDVTLYKNIPEDYPRMPDRLMSKE